MLGVEVAWDAGRAEVAGRVEMQVAVTADVLAPRMNYVGQMVIATRPR
jgi:hypothetical protein